jgi:hypothetical protein
MKDRQVRTLCGAGVVCLLAVGLFICGDRPSPHRLTCADLLDLPLEDLMEVRIVSKSSDRQAPGSPCPPRVLEVPLEGLMQVPIACETTSA